MWPELAGMQAPSSPIRLHYLALSQAKPGLRLVDQLGVSLAYSINPNTSYPPSPGPFDNMT